MPTHITTLVYAQRGDHLALLLRRKAPNQGLWSPPGGKVEPGETPMQNALRELEEETGLVGRSCRLAAVVTERDSHSGEQWLMFVFHCDGVTGELSRGSHEGKPSWVAIADLPLLPCPPADQHIAEAVFSGDGGVAFVNVRFDEGRLTDVTTTRDI